MVSGKVFSTSNEIMDFATVQVKGTSIGTRPNEKGIYHLKVDAGKHTLVFKAMGYATVERTVTLQAGERQKLNVKMHQKDMELAEVKVEASHVGRINKSAFNAVAVDLKGMAGLNKNLAEVLTTVPGVKLRETGGMGSDMQLMLDGFTGKHVKIFIDGVPQEGAGTALNLNNLPVNFAERIEVYRGVVPVGFGTDALGGVINIVTNQRKLGWFADASYSYGSFNTHKSFVNFGQSFKNGLLYEINAFQNFSDNNYYIDYYVTEFSDDGISENTDKTKIYHIKRFNDRFHNEAVSGKIGVADKKWADRLMLGFTYTHFYKEIQNGVLQKVVFGEKHRHGFSFIPSLEYRKRNLWVEGLDVMANVNYNHNITHNIDTASYKYNWLGQRKYTGVPGEQSNQNNEAKNKNWNGTLTANYRIGHAHLLTLNHVLSTFERTTRSYVAGSSRLSDFSIPKRSLKNVTGLSYRFMPTEKWNATVFGKYYNQFVAGPVATDANQNDYVRTTRSVSSIGYGAAGTYFILPGLQAKLSYEKAYRLPTIEEMFGNEDLEMGDIGIRPENSDNVNLNLSYNRTFGRHSVYVEGGLVYRNTKDYIQRNITDLSGGKSAATYINYGKVLTKGYNISARYGFGKWVSVGGNFTQMDVRDNMKTSISGSAENIAYKERMPNLPYIFADSDVTFYWRDLGRKGNALTVSYDNQYLHSFTYYSSKIGSNKGDYVVPSQFSHNLSLSYSLRDGRYNLSFECRNFTDEQLYDNFSLQKAGRAFYGKVRVYFGN